MNFPKKENDVVALANNMVAGYTAYPADFPSVAVADLSTALAAYNTAKTVQEDARGQAKIATANKDELLTELVEQMKNDLKISEVDTTADPEKLAEIGWGTKNPPQPLESPGVPTNAHPIAQGQGMLWLKWDKPLEGGPVRNYIVERRQQSEAGVFGNWSLSNTCYNNDIQLIEQPQNIRLEYRIRSSNEAGQSVSGNVVSIIL